MSDPSSPQPTTQGGLPGAPTTQGGPPGAPPQAPPVPEAELRGASGASGPRAGFWRRFGAYLIDVLVLLVPSILVVVILGNGGAANVLSTLIAIAYFVYFEGGPTGQTIGKRALGIRVFDFRGGSGPIGYGRALVRTLVRYISGLVLLLGYLWMLWDRENQTWHDKAAGSVVVPVDAYPVNA